MMLWVCYCLFASVYVNWFGNQQNIESSRSTIASGQGILNGCRASIEDHGFGHSLSHVIDNLMMGNLGRE